MRLKYYEPRTQEEYEQWCRDFGNITADELKAMNAAEEEQAALNPGSKEDNSINQAKPAASEDDLSPLDLAYTVLKDVKPVTSAERKKKWSEEEDLRELLEMNTDEVFFYRWMR